MVKVGSLPKVKNQMSEEDRRNLELMYEDMRFNALITYTVAYTCIIMAAVVLCQVQTIYGSLGFFALLLMGMGMVLSYRGYWRRGIILKKLGVHKTAEKYGLVKQRKLRKK